MERIKPNSQIPVREIRQTVNEEYQAQISRWIAAKVRKLVLEMIKGSVEYQYKRIWEYCAKIKKTHDGSKIGRAHVRTQDTSLNRMPPSA